MSAAAGDLVNQRSGASAPKLGEQVEGRDLPGSIQKVGSETEELTEIQQRTFYLQATGRAQSPRRGWQSGEALSLCL